MKTSVVLLLFVIIGLGCTCEIHGQNNTNLLSRDFIKTDGARFIDGNGKEYIIKGMGFWGGNNPVAPDSFQESDFSNMADIGFNSIRLYLSANFFENTSTDPVSYKEEIWAWLDPRIMWAKKYNMTLILNMHFTPGASNISDRNLFTDYNLQNRLVALWRVIAEYYKNEPVIAGYDIVNEPTANPVDGENAPYANTFTLYQSIVQRVVDAIREVDTNHIIIVERLWINNVTNPNDQQDDWQNINGNYNFVQINDPCANYALTYHCYEPCRYIHQTVGDDGSAPDRVYPNPATIARWGKTENNGMQLPVQDILSPEATDYIILTNKFHCAPDAVHNTARIDMVFKNLPSDATVWINKVTVKEYDENNIFIRNVVYLDFDYKFDNNAFSNNSVNISVDNTGRFLKATGPVTDGISRTNNVQFIITKGNYYELSVEVKGSNIGNASVYPTFFVANRPDVRGNTKDFLEEVYTLPLNYITKITGVPAYIGEFGVHAGNFLDNHYGINRGADKWIEDVYDIFKKYKINSNFHPYYEREIRPKVHEALADALRKAFSIP